jgi:hypothetical protein
MQREANKLGGADPKKIKAYSEQLQALQRQITVTPALQPKPATGPAK